jgi:predicted GNAT family acetyltransferase
MKDPERREVAVSRFDDATRFLERAESWLMASEAENNLILAVAHRLRGTGSEHRESSAYLAVVERGGEVRGCAFRTPPLKVGITRMPHAAIAHLAEDIRRVYPEIPGVLGPEPEAGIFAATWGERSDVRFEVGMRQGIYRLQRVRPPRSSPAGRLRLADRTDMAQAVEWSSSFVRETHVFADRDLAGSVLAKIDDGTLWLWDDGGPRSMAAEGGRTPNGSRIGWVYTPPEWRGRGYASACVAKLSAHLLASGRRFCFLYTDLANETSNALYQRIGYEKVCDAIDYRFTDAE